MTDLWDEMEAAGAGGGAPPLRPRRKKSHPVRNVLIVIAGLVVLVLLGVGGFVWNLAHTFDHKTQKIEQSFPEEKDRPKEVAGTGQNYLLLGSDSRSGDAGIDEAGPTNKRSDTMMVIHVDADRKNVQVMSIMRDSWVSIAGHGKAKVNAAMSYGGIPLTVETVESLIGARIDHVAVIDFEGFKGMTDSLGGVDVDVPIAFTSKNVKGYSFTKGINHLDGDAALAFVRDRYSFADGDYQRVRDQQAFLKAVIDRLLSVDTLSSPAKVNGFVSSMSPYLTVDKGLDFSELVKIGAGLKDIRSSNIQFFTAPTSGTGTSADGQSIVNLDAAKMKRVKAAFQHDELRQYLASEESND